MQSTLRFSQRLPGLAGMGAHLNRIRLVSQGTWRHRFHPYRFSVFLAALGLFLAAHLRSEPAPAELEYKIKAGYLVNFARFVEWPDKTWLATNSPIVIGIFGSTETFRVMEPVIRGKNVNDRPLEVKRLESAQGAAGCQILFICREAGLEPAEARRALGANAALLVGETTDFAQEGGMIGFVREEDSFRLTLNVEAATQRGLKISAKLSNVARLVKSKPPR